MKKYKAAFLLTLICLACSVILFLSSCNQTEQPATPTEHTVTFVADGQTHTTVTTVGNEVIAMPSDPVKDGYTFDGWYVDEGTWQTSFTAGSFAFSTLSKDISVYAKFSKITAPPNDDDNTKSEYIIKFIVDDAEYASVKTAGNETVKMPNDPKKEDYTFDGWYWDNESWQLTFKANSLLYTPLTVNTAVYAHFVKQVTPSEPITPDKPILTDGWKIVVDATCTVAGQMERINPETNQKETKVIVPLGHVYGEYVVTKEPTCSVEGNKVKTCLRCRNVVEEKIDTVEHQPSEWIVLSESTCSQTGLKIKQCINCKTQLESQSIQLKDHATVEWIVEKEPTCETFGQKRMVCVDCHANLYSESVMLEHTFNEQDVCSSCGCSNLLYSESGDYWNNGVSVIGFVNDEISHENLVIPHYNNGKEVVGISDNAFSHSRDIVSITIPRGVTNIGKLAFGYCSALDTVYWNAEECDNLPYFDCIFEECVNFSTIIIGDNVTSVPDCAFNVCVGIKNITIGKSVNRIAGNAFPARSNIENIYYTGSLTDWCNIDFGSEVDRRPFNNGFKFYINNELVTEAVIPHSISTIKDCTFSNFNSLTKITIPNNVTSIGKYAFSGCSSLQDVTIPDTITRISEYAFSGCSSLQDITIPDNIKSISKGLFSNCSSLTNIVISNKVNSIGDSAFSGCTSLESLTLGNNLVFVGSYAFYGCSNLTSITIPDSVTSIGAYAFSHCSNLTSITIPDSVTSIENYAFEVCNSLACINYLGTIESWCNIQGLDNLMRYGTTSKTLSINGELVAEIIIPAAVTSIQSCTFYKTNITSVTFEDNSQCTSIGVDAFSDCSSLTSISMPDSVTSIGVRAFEGCSSLTSVTIPNSVTDIERDTFTGCSKLTSIIIGSSVTHIDNSVFSSLLKTVYYNGTAEDWSKINIGSYNSPLTSATRYYYSETEPALNVDGTDYDGNYWHYDTDGKTPVVWKKQ